jgi:hypothetical protein
MADFETDTLALKKKIGRIADNSDNIDYTGTPNDPSWYQDQAPATPSYFDSTPAQNRTIPGSIKALLGTDSPNTSSAQPVAVANPATTASTVTGSTTQPQSAESTPTAQPIAGGMQLPKGVLQFHAMGSPTSQVDVSVANNSTSDWSPNSANVKTAESIAGLNVAPTQLTSDYSIAQPNIDGIAQPDRQISESLGTLSNAADRGMTYDEQVAHAQEVNANTMRQLAQLSPREAADLAISQDPYRSDITRANAASDALIAQGRIASIGQQIKDDQAMQIANASASASKYAADQGLAGHKLTSDANLKAAELAANANVRAHEIQALAATQAAQMKNQQFINQLHLEPYKKVLQYGGEQAGIDYQNYVNGLNKWMTGVQTVFNATPVGKAYLPLYQQYMTEKDPEKRKAIEQTDQFNNMLGYFNATAKKAGMQPTDLFKRPELPANLAVLLNKNTDINTLLQQQGQNNG